MDLTQPLFEARVLRQFAGNDAQLLAELVEIFLRTVPATNLLLRQAAQRQHRAAIASQAHEMRSSLMMVGAADTSAWCERIERLARGDADPALYADTKAFCADVDAVVAQVLSWFGKPGATNPHEGNSHA